MPSRSIDDLDPKIRGLCSQFLSQCKAEGIQVFLTCIYRSNEEQDAAYTKGRTAPGKIITNAKAGQSAHNCVNAQGLPAARAFDFAIKTASGQLDWDGTDARWQRAIHVGESLGLSSGEHFKRKDYAHLELMNWKTLA